ncbi:MAG: J domain-containing protein [Hormoscilla sp.]
MANPLNHYQTLEVSPAATQAEIKQAYRRQAKRFHPDSNRATADHEKIASINAAYEVLGDPQKRRSYDRQFNPGPKGQKPYPKKDKQYQRNRQTGQDIDEHLQQWLKQVYVPVNRLLARILNSLEGEIYELSADPFDDELLSGFQEYLEECREFLSEAQSAFSSMPNPANVASVAAHLYYCLNQVGDGIEELNWFPLNYDEHYLHTGKELFRIAAGLRREAHRAIKDMV